MPFLRVLVLAFALAHATGLSDAVEAARAGDCAEDDCDDGCPPSCLTCQCARCPTGDEVAVVAITAPPPHLVPTSFVVTARVPSSPDPREILHVPIALLV